MQKIVEAENSDLFDVLSFVAFATAPISRELRAAAARRALTGTFNDKQRAFVDFVLAQYVVQGVRELDQEKLPPLLKLRYRNSIPDAIADLGEVERIRDVFIGFQKFLYQEPRAT